MYSFQSRIRYSELDETGHLRLQSLLDYFQDCSTFQSEDLGLGVAHLRDQHMVWVLSSWQIVAERYPALGEKVTIATAPYAFKGFLGYRNFWMLDEAGNRIACANSLWTLLDTQSGHPVKATEDMLKGYVLSPKLDMEYAPRKIPVPEQLIQGKAVQIRKYHLDTNQHVNNGQYVRIAMDSLDQEFRIRQLRAEYKKQVLLGDELIPWTAETNEGKVVVLKDKNEEICCIVELQGERELV